MTQIINDIQLDFQDVLIQPKRSTLCSRKEVDIYRDFGKNIIGFPLMNANMATVGNFNIAEILLKNGCFATLHKFYEPEEINNKFLESVLFKNNFLNLHRLFLSVGVRDSFSEFEKILKYNAENPDSLLKKCSILIDVPNAYIPQVKELVILIKKTYYANNLIMVGNVVTGELTQDLILSGADIVKVGIGPGSQCSTRIKTGVGRPQLSTILECSDAAHQVNGLICADGGITCSGDIVKALGAGADFVMSGSMFASCDESEGEIIEKITHTEYVTSIPNNCCVLSKKGDFYYEVGIIKKFKEYFGMSSTKAQKEYFGKVEKYRASEGIISQIPCTGPLQNILDDIFGGIRSAMTYIGARKLKHIPKQTTFYRVSRQVNRI